MPAEPFQCPDCNEFCATQIDSLCPNCQQWRDRKFVKMDDEWQDKLDQRKRFRPLSAMSGADFGEDLADMVKAVERSRQQ